MSASFSAPTWNLEEGAAKSMSSAAGESVSARSFADLFVAVVCAGSDSVAVAVESCGAMFGAFSGWTSFKARPL